MNAFEKLQLWLTFTWICPPKMQNVVAKEMQNVADAKCLTSLFTSLVRQVCGRSLSDNCKTLLVMTNAV